MTRFMNLSGDSGPSTSVTLITGFLGSGKTTLLNELLRRPEMSDAAVIVNEFGQIPIDQIFFDLPEDEIAVLPNGCLCCVARDDLEEALIRLVSRARPAGEPLARIFIETSGLADPAPVAQLVMNTPVPSGTLALAEIITTVDAEHARKQSADHPEWVKQVALADRIILTKTDRHGEADLLDARRIVASINGDALHHRASRGVIADKALPFLDPGDYAAIGDCDREHHEGCAHGQAVVTWSIVTQQALDWAIFSRWFRRIRREYGEALLRVKGVLNIEGDAQALAIDAIHFVAYPPRPMPRTAGQARETRLVFIVQGIPATTFDREWHGLLVEHARAEPA